MCNSEVKHWIKEALRCLKIGFMAVLFNFVYTDNPWHVDTLNQHLIDPSKTEGYWPNQTDDYQLRDTHFCLTMFPFVHRYHWQEWTEGVLREQLFSDLFYLLWKFHYTGMQLKTKRCVYAFLKIVDLLNITLDCGSIINHLPVLCGMPWGKCLFPVAADTQSDNISPYKIYFYTS